MSSQSTPLITTVVDTQLQDRASQMCLQYAEPLENWRESERLRLFDSQQQQLRFSELTNDFLSMRALVNHQQLEVQALREEQSALAKNLKVEENARRAEAVHHFASMSRLTEELSREKQARTEKESELSQRI